MNHFIKKSIFVPSLITSALLASFNLHAQADEQNNEVERIVVTATMTEHSELSSPASVSVITAEDIAKMPVKDISEAIRGVAGIQVQGSTAYGRNSIRVRGMDSKHTLILINGRRINSQDALIRGNDFDLGTIPLAAVERIEVVRGPVASLYGSEAMGGVVNVILKDATEGFSGSVGLEYESLLEGQGGDNVKGHAYVSGELASNLAGSLIVESSSRDPWQTEQNPDFDAIEKRDSSNILADLAWQISDSQKLSADIIFSKDEREADWLHPASGSHENAQSSTRWNYGLTHEGAWSGFDSQVRVYGESMVIDDASSAYSNGETEAELQNNAVDFNLSGLLFDEHTWVFGSEYRTTTLKNERDLASGKIENYQGAVFLQGEFAISDLSLTIGGREDFHEVYGSHFSPRAYAVYSLTDEFVLKGGAGGGFRAPSMMESSDQVRIISCGNRCWLTGNDELEPEESVSYEAGFAYQSDTKGLGLMYFNSSIKNKIERDTSTAVGMEGRTPLITYQNIGKAEIEGVELDMWFDVTSSINVSANYTYTDAIDKESGDPLLKTPEHLANLDFNWRVIKDLNTFVRANYIGEQVITNSRRESVKVDDYSLIGLGLGYDFEQLKLKAGINNIFNTVLDEGDDYYGYSEKGRSIYAIANYEF